MSDPVWSEADHGLVRFKIAVLREAIAAMEAEGPDKIVMIEMEGRDPEFFTVRFALSGEALERLDLMARESGYLVVTEDGTA